MKREVLEILIEKWECKGTEPEVMSGLKEDELNNARIVSSCKTYNVCANELRGLIDILEE